MTEQTHLRKLLVLHGPSLAADGILPLLQDHFDVQVVHELEQALEAMRGKPFHAVLAETADFLPLERGVVTQQAAVVLDTIADGVGIVGPQGQLVWANRRLRNYPPPVLQSLREVCSHAFSVFSQGGDSECLLNKRFSILPEDGSYYEVICSAVRDGAGQVQQVAAVVVNATSQRRQQTKLNAIDRAGRELVRLDNETLANRDAGQRLQLLEERIIRCSRDVLHYQHFSVLLLDQRTNKLESLICEGMDEGHKKIEMFASTESNGICGYVAATGQCYICGDTQKDPRCLPLLAGARSLLTVPLRLQDKVVGVLNVESDHEGAFGEEDRQFAEIFANYVAMALNVLNLLVFERYSAHTQMSGSITAELAGPLNDIITCAGELVEDYIGHDDIRKRLGTIIDMATEARKRMQQVVDSPRSGVFGAGSCSSLPKDPVLGGKKILVADDEELIRQTIGDVLAQQGCIVELADNGTTACEKVRTGNYDLVISDIKMPGASGYEVFSAAKAARASTQVILITAFGYDPHHSIVKANKEGLAAVLMKPFKVRQLLDHCRTAIQGNR